MTKVGAAAAGGSAPDIIAVDLIVQQFSARPPADRYHRIGQVAALLRQAEPLACAPGHVRRQDLPALPFNAEGSILLWNKDLFKEAGLDPEKPPTTWAEIAEAAKQITALGDDKYGYYFSGSCAGCNAFTYLPLMWASGGDVLNADGSTATVTDPNVAAALDFYRQLWADGQIHRARRPTPARTLPMPSPPARSACPARAPLPSACSRTTTPRLTSA